MSGDNEVIIISSELSSSEGKEESEDSSSSSVVMITPKREPVIIISSDEEEEDVIISTQSGNTNTNKKRNESKSSSSGRPGRPGSNLNSGPPISSLADPTSSSAQKLPTEKRSEKGAAGKQRENSSSSVSSNSSSSRISFRSSKEYSGVGTGVSSALSYRASSLQPKVSFEQLQSSKGFEIVGNETSYSSSSSSNVNSPKSDHGSRVTSAGSSSYPSKYISIETVVKSVVKDGRGFSGLGGKGRERVVKAIVDFFGTVMYCKEKVAETKDFSQRRHVLVKGVTVPASTSPSRSFSDIRDYLLTFWDDSAVVLPPEIEQGNVISATNLFDGYVYGGCEALKVRYSTEFSVLPHNLYTGMILEHREDPRFKILYSGYDVFDNPRPSSIVRKHAIKLQKRAGKTYDQVARVIVSPVVESSSHASESQTDQRVPVIGSDIIPLTVSDRIDDIVEQIMSMEIAAEGDVLGDFEGFASEDDKGFINTHSKPLFLRFRPLSRVDVSKLIILLKKLYDIDHDHEFFNKNRISGISFGRVYCGLFPEDEVFRHPISKDYLFHNPHGKFSSCFDVPSTERNMQTTRYFQLDLEYGGISPKASAELITIVSRTKRYQDCKNFCTALWQASKKKDTRARKAVWVTDPKELPFYVVQFCAPASCSLDDLENVRVSHKLSAVRSNPVHLASAMKRNLAGSSVKQAVKETKRVSHVRGPADEKVTANQIHARNSRKKDESRDTLYYLHNEKLNPSDGVKFLHRIGDHMKGGWLLFMCIVDIFILWGSCKVLFESKSLIAYTDTTFEYGTLYLTYIVLRFDCFSTGPMHVVGAWMLHTWLDAETYKWFFRCLCDIVGPRFLPEIILRDEDDALALGIELAKRVYFNSKCGKTLQDLICLWHLLRSLVRKGKQLGFSEKQRNDLKYKAIELLLVGSLEEFDKNLPIFRKFILNDIQSPEFAEYFNKSKSLVLRERIRKLALATPFIISSDIPSLISLHNAVKVNHPIEGKNTWIKINIEILDTMQKRIENLKTESIYERDMVFKAIMGTSPKHKFTEDAMSYIKEHGLDKIRKGVLSEFYKTKDRKEQVHFVHRFATEFPGLLDRLGFPEPSEQNFSFNSDSDKWVMKNLPRYDLAEFTRELDLVVNLAEAKAEMLKYINNHGSFKILSMTQMAFYSMTFRKFMNATLSATYVMCEIHGENICVHILLFAFVQGLKDALKKWRFAPRSLRNLYPEVIGGRGKKKGQRKGSKAHDSKILVKEFPVASVRGNQRVFLGLNKLLFESPLHHGKMPLCIETLLVYNKKELQGICRTKKFRNFSKIGKAEDLRKFVFLKLEKIAMEDCVFCDRGQLGFVCEGEVCRTKSVILTVKGFALDVKEVENIRERLMETGLDDVTFLKCHNSKPQLITTLCSCVLGSGRVIDDLKFDTSLYEILREFELYKAIMIEKDIVEKKLLRFSYVWSGVTLSDGNCLFDSSANQFLVRRTFIGAPPTHQVVRRESTRWLRDNAHLITPSGIALCDRYGGIDEFLKTVSDLEKDGVYGDEVAVVGIVNVYQVVMDILNSDPNYEHPLRPTARIRSPWQDIQPFKVEGDISLLPHISVAHYLLGEHFQSIVQKLFQLGEELEKELEVEVGPPSIENVTEADGKEAFDYDGTEREFVALKRKKDVTDIGKDDSDENPSKHRDINGVRRSFRSLIDSLSDEDESEGETTEHEEHGDSTNGEKEKEVERAIEIEEEDVVENDRKCGSCGWFIQDESNGVECCLFSCGKLLHRSKPEGLNERCCRKVELGYMCKECFSL